jgi:hypothetical protein
MPINLRENRNMFSKQYQNRAKLSIAREPNSKNIFLLVDNWSGLIKPYKIKKLVLDESDYQPFYYPNPTDPISNNSTDLSKSLVVLSMKAKNLGGLSYQA